MLFAQTSVGTAFLARMAALAVCLFASLFLPRHPVAVLGTISVAAGGGLSSLAWSGHGAATERSEEHTSELQSLMRNSYAVFCLKKKTLTYEYHHHHNHTH